MDQSSPSNSAGHDKSFLVGREREQSVLRRALDEMLAGHGSLVLVSGEAGIGKTTLIEWLVRLAENADCLVLWGRAYDLSVTPPYGPWVELARRHEADGHQPPLPDFLVDPEALVALGSQERLLNEATGFFRSVAAQRPLLLILDDLHWADHASLDLLRFLARQVSNHRLLLIAIYRGDELARDHPLYRLLPLLVREAAAIRLGLQRLNETEQRCLIRQHYTLSAADEQRLEKYLYARAEGNPLYLGELLRTLEEQRALQPSANGWHLGPLEKVRVPDLLVQVIEGRLSRLSEQTRELLNVAAVIGQTVPLDLWEAASTVGPTVLLEVMESALAAALVDVLPDGSCIYFRHALIREALYESILPLRRRIWHRKLAEILVATTNPDPDQIAYHFQQARDDRAVTWLIRAGERAQRSYVWATAVERFGAALAKRTEQGASATERAGMMLHIATLLRYSDPPRALTLVEEARQLAAEAGDQGLVCHCQIIAGLYQCLGGRFRSGLLEMRQGVALLESLSRGDQERLKSVVGAHEFPPSGTLVLWLALVGYLEEARTRGERMRAEVTTPALPRGQGGSSYADGLYGLALAQAQLGLTTAAQRTFQEARAAYHTVDHHVLEAETCFMTLELVQLRYFTDERETRAQLAVEAVAAGQRALVGGNGFPAEAYAFSLILLEGSWMDVRHLAQRLYEDDNRSFSISGGLWLAALARLQGDLSLAQRVIADVLPDGPRSEPGSSMLLLPALILQRVASALALDQHDLLAAHAWLESHDRWLDWSGAVLGRADCALLWARYHQLSGDSKSARNLGEQSLRQASDPRQPLVLISVRRFLGELDREDRRFAEADVHFRLSLELAEACASRFEWAMTLLALAELRGLQGQDAEARTLLTQARTVFDQLRAQPALEQLSAVELRLDQPKRASNPYGLSSRELDVLRLAAEGLTDALIAETLFIGRRTASTHLRNVFNKMGVNNRAAAVAVAVRDGLVQVPGE